MNIDDAAALEQGGKYIKALIPAVVNIVYKKLLTYDIAARAFTTRSTSYEGPIDSQPTLTSPQVEHRKNFLRGYLAKLCTDPMKMEFWEYMDKVGMMHVGRGRKHPLHVDYVHVGMLLGYVQDVMMEAILSHPRLSLGMKTKVVKALGKVLWIQNDLFAKWYVRDGDEFLTDMNNSDEECEPEGVLHGKMVNNTLSDEDWDESDETNSPRSLHAVGLGITADGKGKAVGDTAIARAVERERVDEMGGCPFSGLMGVEAPHPIPVGSPKVDAK
ncbi:Protoglobin-domain-containing protein [Tirmania nivea]|nr:Protoglobin-domain-containing protein [Tirmania nivea]